MKRESKKKETFPARFIGMASKMEMLERFKIEREEEKEEYQNSQANLLALIENTKNSIWSVDRAYRILTINSHFKREFSAAFGIDLEEGMRIIDCVPHEMKKIWVDRYQRALKGENFTIEEEFKVGRKFIHTEISFNPIRQDGQVTGVSVFARDVTKRKQTEEALRDSE